MLPEVQLARTNWLRCLVGDSPYSSRTYIRGGSLNFPQGWDEDNEFLAWVRARNLLFDRTEPPSAIDIDALPLPMHVLSELQQNRIRERPTLHIRDNAKFTSLEGQAGIAGGKDIDPICRWCSLLIENPLDLNLLITYQRPIEAFGSKNIVSWIMVQISRDANDPPSLLVVKDIDGLELGVVKLHGHKREDGLGLYSAVLNLLWQFHQPRSDSDNPIISLGQAWMFDVLDLNSRRVDELCRQVLSQDISVTGLDTL